MKPEVAASMADKWLKRVDISDRIAELKAQAEAAASLRREQLVEFLSKIITAQPCDVGRTIRIANCSLQAGSAFQASCRPANIQRQPVVVRTGFRGNDFHDSEPGILDRFFGKPDRTSESFVSPAAV
jgi:hypothetical protein